MRLIRAIRERIVSVGVDVNQSTHVSRRIRWTAAETRPRIRTRIRRRLDQCKSDGKDWANCSVLQQHKVIGQPILLSPLIHDEALRRSLVRSKFRPVPIQELSNCSDGQPRRSDKRELSQSSTPPHFRGGVYLFMGGSITTFNTTRVSSVLTVTLESNSIRLCASSQYTDVTRRHAHATSMIKLTVNTVQ